MNITASKLIVWVGLLVGCLSTVGAQARGHHQSGIVGQTTLGQICDTNGCVPLPVQSRVRIFSAETGRLIADIATDADGLFAVALKPGTYFMWPYILPAPSSLPGGTLFGATTTVTVQKKEFTEALVRFEFQGVSNPE